MQSPSPQATTLRIKDGLLLPGGGGAPSPSRDTGGNLKGNGAAASAADPLSGAPAGGNSKKAAAGKADRSEVSVGRIRANAVSRALAHLRGAILSSRLTSGCVAQIVPNALAGAGEPSGASTHHGSAGVRRGKGPKWEVAGPFPLTVTQVAMVSSALDPMPEATEEAARNLDSLHRVASDVADPADQSGREGKEGDPGSSGSNPPGAGAGAGVGVGVGVGVGGAKMGSRALAAARVEREKAAEFLREHGLSSPDAAPERTAGRGGGDDAKSTFHIGRGHNEWAGPSKAHAPPLYRAVRADSKAVYLSTRHRSGIVAVTAGSGFCVLGHYSDRMAPLHAALETEAAAVALANSIAASTSIANDKSVSKV